MTAATPLMPPPGNYRLPTMPLLRIAATDDPAVIQLVFRAERVNAGQTEQLTISVPLQVLDAAGLLRSLRILQDEGVVPIVVAPERQTPN